MDPWLDLVRHERPFQIVQTQTTTSCFKILPTQEQSLLWNWRLPTLDIHVWLWKFTLFLILSFRRNHSFCYQEFLIFSHHFIKNLSPRYFSILENIILEIIIIKSIISCAATPTHEWFILAFKPFYSPVECLDEIEKFLVNEICIPILESKTLDILLNKMRDYTSYYASEISTVARSSVPNLPDYGCPLGQNNCANQNGLPRCLHAGTPFPFLLSFARLSMVITSCHKGLTSKVSLQFNTLQSRCLWYCSIWVCMHTEQAGNMSDHGGKQSYNLWNSSPPLDSVGRAGLAFQRSQVRYLPWPSVSSAWAVWTQPHSPVCWHLARTWSTRWYQEAFAWLATVC